MTTAQLGTVHAASGATLDFAGTLNNIKATFHVGAGVLLDGAIDGGTINGAVNLTASGQSLAFLGGPTVKNAAGTGPGTINVTGEYADLYFDNTQTFNNATINLGNTIGYTDTLYAYDTAGAGGQVLTLASGVTVDVVGYAAITSSSSSGDGIVNKGVINDATSPNVGSLTIEGNAFTNQGSINVENGQNLTVDSTTFANTGTITVDGGATASIAPSTFTNLPSHTLTGGIYEVEAGSTLQVDGFASITTLNADVILSGSGSQFLDDYTGASSATALDSLLRTIGAEGELQLLAGRNWTTAGAAITNDGIIQLGGGT